jgi:hypothetical protein
VAGGAGAQDPVALDGEGAARLGKAEDPDQLLVYVELAARHAEGAGDREEETLLEVATLVIAHAVIGARGCRGKQRLDRLERRRIEALREALPFRAEDGVKDARHELPATVRAALGAALRASGTPMCGHAAEDARRASAPQ